MTNMMVVYLGLLSASVLAAVPRLAVRAASTAPTSPVATPGALQYGPAYFLCPAVFPSSVFTSFYPVPTGQQPQPIIVDEAASTTYAYNVTNPTAIPTVDLYDPVIYPVPTVANTTASVNTADKAFEMIASIIAGNSSLVSGSSSNCTKCQAALEVGQQLARINPADVPVLLTNLCTTYAFSSAATCKLNYMPQYLGATITQVLAYANTSGLDGRYICFNWISGYCPEPATHALNTTAFFDTPKPANVSVPPASGQRIKVLHLSDFHLDPRYENGAEANCSSGLCCRSDAHNTASPSSVLSAAPKYGAFLCDTPYDLALAALQAIPALSSPNGTADFAMTLYTGDLVSHDPGYELSRVYTEEVETVMYRLFKRFFGNGPVYAALGNHDTYNVAQDAPMSLPGMLSQQDFSWNYDHVARLWQTEGWLNSSEADQAATHYGAYSVKVPGYNLRVITINTDFWYKSNYFNYINMTNPDVSGTLKFLGTELAGAEQRGERVWIVGHVLSGWDGSNPLKDPTNLFYAIVDRYAPHTIANIFFGHTHEDQFTVFFSGNGTNQSLANAVATAWIAPSITPLTNLNSGFRIYEVDTGDFNVYEAHTYYSNVSTFTSASMNNTGISYQLEYSSRSAYDPNRTYPATAPLDAKFWYQQTLNMAAAPSLMSNFTTYQGKMSAKTTNCTSSTCVSAKLCYMRSGSATLGKACKQGYGSVQGS